MKIRRPLALFSLLFALALSAGAQEQSAPTPPPVEEPVAQQTMGPFEVEIGFRTLDVAGNEDMYRTQINERSGLLLRSLTLLSADAGGLSSRFIDRLRVDATELGADPAGALRIEADKSDVYHFRLGYRHSNAFSALPAFANPFIGQGVVPGQHTYDRTRHTLDADLDLLPGRIVTPFIGFSLHRSSGPGTTTYTLGGDEFRLSQDLTDREQELRLGTGFNIGWLYGSVTQGWRRARSRELLSLEATEGNGNTIDPLLGRPVFATIITREDRTQIDTPFTNLFVTGLVGRRLRISGDYVRFAADSSGDLAEAASGSFVSFALGRFFDGLSDSATSSAKNTTWRGGGRAELVVRDDIVAFAGYESEHRELEGSALIHTLHLQTITFGGIDPRDLQAILQANGSIERIEDVMHAGAAVRALGPFAMRVEIRAAKQHVAVAPDLAEIVIPGSQGGDFERRITTLDANASYTMDAFTLGAAYRRDHANEPIFRTDYRDRDRIRLRAAWKGLTWIRAGVTAEQTRQSNDQTAIQLDGKVRQFSGNVEITPHQRVTFRASVSRFRADNSILVRRPENFVTEPSLYVEDGRAREGGVAVNFAPLSFDVNAARFRNTGANPFDIHRLRARIGFDLPASTKTGLIVEYASDEYTELADGSGDFEARRFGFYVRYRP